MMEGVEVLDWIERFGGWAVVLLVVRWMMNRIDKMIDGWQSALDQFATFEQRENEFHEGIMQTQREILSAIRNIRS